MQSRVRSGRVAAGVAVVLLALAVPTRSGRAHPGHSGPHQESGTALPPPPDDSKLKPEDAARRAEVALRYDGGQITIGQLEEAILGKNPHMQERYTAAEALRALIDRSLRFELLAAEAQRRGYDKHAKVSFQVAQHMVQALIRNEFDTKITTDSVPSEDVKKYYDEHTSEFVRPESRRASVLVVASEAEAKELLPKSQAADMRVFRDLVRDKSIDETNKNRSGDLGYFDAKGRLMDAGETSDAGTLDLALVKAVFALKNAGDTSGIVKLEQHFGIVKLTGQRAAQGETLKQADSRIRFRLWRERRETAIDSRLAELRKESQVEVHPELIDAVKLDASPLPPGKGMPPGFPQTRPTAAKGSP